MATTTYTISFPISASYQVHIEAEEGLAPEHILNLVTPEKVYQGGEYELEDKPHKVWANNPPSKEDIYIQCDEYEGSLAELIE